MRFPQIAQSRTHNLNDYIPVFFITTNQALQPSILLLHSIPYVTNMYIIVKEIQTCFTESDINTT